MREELIKAIVALLETTGERELDLIYRFVKNITAEAPSLRPGRREAKG